MRSVRLLKDRRSFIESLERRCLLAGSRDLVADGILEQVADIGVSGTPVSFSHASGSYVLGSAGTGIGTSADSFSFAYTRIEQDFTLVARVRSPADATPQSVSGIMIRNDGASTTNAPMAALVVNGPAIRFIYRTSAGAFAFSTSLNGNTDNIFLKLHRDRHTIRAEYASQDADWQPIGNASGIAIQYTSGTSHAGLVATSGQSTLHATATFDQVGIIGNGANWSFDAPGNSHGFTSHASASYESTAGMTSLISAGSGLQSSGDDIAFASRPLVGDGSVIARPAEVGIGGVMIRADARNAVSPFAAIFRDADAIRFAWRTTTGGSVQSTSITIPAAVSLKVVRDGNHFQGFYSTTGGASWQRIGAAVSVLIAMPAQAHAGLFAASLSKDVASTSSFTGVSIGAITSPGAGILTPDDERFLDDLQRRTALWFTSTQNATSGLFPDRANAQPGWLGGDSSIASTGFGLSALVIASSRGWISDGYARALRTLNFLLTDADMTNPTNRGFYYHFVNQTTGSRAGNSELSSIDTALLIAGVLTVGQYWKGTALEAMANQIYQRVDWTYMQPDGAGTQLRMGWTPEAGFLGARWDSWSEGPLLYLLAMGSPTHPIHPASWHAFARNTNMTTYAGTTFYHAHNAPLFTNQYPQGWFDLRAKSDTYDADPSTSRVVHIDPFQNAQRHTLAQRQASIAAGAGSDPRYAHFGTNVWGLTASDTPTGYAVSGGPPIVSDGTIAPTAPGGSLAFTPREAIDCLVNLKTQYPSTYRAWGFIDAFNPRPGINWYDNDAIGIDQGMILVAAENLRSGLVWNTFMSHPAAQSAIAIAFTDNHSYATPAIESSAFHFETDHAARIVFNQDVSASLSNTDLAIVNLTTGNAVPSANWSLQKTTAGQLTIATITFFTPLADGNYALQILPNSIARPDGTTNVSTQIMSFHVLSGDANRDKIVDFSDLLILAQNYGTTGRTFSSGNFDYSSDGAVTFDDLLLLAQHYGAGLPGITAERSETASERPRSTRRIVSDVL